MHAALQRVKRVARRYCDAPDVDDVVQDALIAVWQRGDDWTDTRFIYELRTLARNRRRAELARRAREQRWLMVN